MTLRRHESQCSRLMNGSHRYTSDLPLLLFLDANFCVLAASELKFPSPLTSFTEDMRLFVREGNLLASYDLWQRKPYFPGDSSRGFWLAPIVVQSTSDSQSPLMAFLNVSEAVRLGGPGEKNLGLFMRQTQLNAVTWLDVARNPSLLQRSFAVPHVWHNNVNFVNLDGMSGDMFGVDHIHRDYNPNAGAANPFKYGFAYSHRFFTIQGEPPFEKTRISKEFCIRASNGKCESVQFVMSMEPLGDGRVLLTYGANDCTAKLALLNASTILQLLQPVESGSPVPTKRAHEAIPVLRDFAEVLFVAPPRRFIELHGHAATRGRAGRTGTGKVASAFTRSRGGSSLSRRKRKRLNAWLNAWLNKGLQQLETLAGSSSYEQLGLCEKAGGPYAGWPLCVDWLPRSACVMYDVGEGTNRKMTGKVVAELGCEAHAFDPLGQYVGDISSSQERKNFTSEMHVDAPAKGAFDGNATLSSFVAKSVHKRIDLLKIDCSGCEWTILRSLMELAPHATRCVHTVLVRMSMPNSDDTPQSVLDVIRFTQNQSWKVWFATKTKWSKDGDDQAPEWWLQQGGDGQSYKIGFVNSKFNSKECLN
eukprot:TRINITY_DN7307_c0_g2_i2.p1 TRINITY_DN7307_c0_g2~~TRINITY_DN7307_c0_g2_i2.p1  ORF type:complete len:589 (-),score=52.36 TRINITY_DN7307_c0_g2_i2:227-1993(-)